MGVVRLPPGEMRVGAQREIFLAKPWRDNSKLNRARLLRIAKIP